MRFQPLDRSLYAPSARRVARDLLGHWLLRRVGKDFWGGPIVETEAYLQNDPASHGFPGLSSRNRVMFGPPGHAYVYLIYGCHFCVNAVCRPAGVAEAVLIRAIVPELGLEHMRRYRPAGSLVALTNGPAKLCQALDIDRSLDGADLCAAESEIIVAHNPDALTLRRQSGPVVTATRIGITRAAERPLRFYLHGSASVSRKPRAHSLEKV